MFGVPPRKRLASKQDKEYSKVIRNCGLIGEIAWFDSKEKTEGGNSRLCLKWAICRRPAASIVGFVDLHRRLAFEIACFGFLASVELARPLGCEPLFRQSLELLINGMERTCQWFEAIRVMSGGSKLECSIPQSTDYATETMLTASSELTGDGLFVMVMRHKKEAEHPLSFCKPWLISIVRCSADIV